MRDVAADEDAETGHPTGRVDTGTDSATGRGARASAQDRVVMRARLAVIAVARDTDTPSVAALRALLRDETLMAHVVANVEQWPPLDDEQRDVLGELFQRGRRYPLGCDVRVEPGAARVARHQGELRPAASPPD
jgi:hypothetical protein